MVDVLEGSFTDNVISDAKGTIIDLTPGGYKLLGYQKGELRMKNIKLSTVSTYLEKDSSSCDRIVISHSEHC